MADTDTAGAGRTSRCKRLHYHAWHRGTREMDLLLGPFADSVSASWNESKLAAFERLLDKRDDELHDLIVRNGTLGDADEMQLIENLRAFHHAKAKA